jgi:hypothetical protein
MVHLACNPLASHALHVLPFYSRLVLQAWHRVQAVACFLVAPLVSADKFVVSPRHSTSNVAHHCSQLPSLLPLLVFLVAWEKQRASTTNYILHTTVNSIGYIAIGSLTNSPPVDRCIHDLEESEFEGSREHGLLTDTPVLVQDPAFAPPPAQPGQ